MSRTLRAGAFFGFIFAIGGPVGAQVPEASREERIRLLYAYPQPRSQPQSPPGSTLGAAALSLVLPGAGQHVLGQRRKWAYAALEVLAWTVFFERRSAGGEYRDRYRDFAWEQGRIRNGARVDGDFDYYETLSQWTASGAFDAEPGTVGVQPEPDAATYNGSIWELATQIFIPGGGPAPETDPAYQNALEYYGERAYDEAFLWDWSGTPGGREELSDLIKASDDRFRHATTALGAVIANHLVSAVDAYLSARGGSAPLRLGVVPAGLSGPLGWSTVVSIPLGR